jgi:general secretion pathway protein K
MMRARSNPARRALVRNERGVALLVVLMVVALLTITVTEFTYSAQIDAHRTRNALHALQAQLLARSGVNLAEGFLMLDEDATYDAYSEEWWLHLLEFCKGAQLDETTLLRCRVRDESGKLNINNTKEARRFAQAQGVTKSAVLRDAMRCMFQGLGIEVDIVDRLADYWQQDAPPLPNGQPGTVPEFTSLEDFGATFGIPTELLHKLRPVMTAQPSSLLPSINVNTASQQVLVGVLTDDAPTCSAPDVVAEILERQRDIERPFKNTGEIPLQNLDNGGVKRQLFAVRSRLYRLEASALTNVDPQHSGGSGIGQTLSALVARTQGGRTPPGGPQVGPSGKPLPNWTLRPLDWQKEGGARLFRRDSIEDENLPGSPEDEYEDEDEDEGELAGGARSMNY